MSFTSKILLFTTLLAYATCEPPVNYLPPSNYAAQEYQAPQYLPPQSYQEPSNNYLPPTSYDGGNDHGHGHHDEHGEPKSYEFGYSVKDAHSGNDYDRHETSDGNTVRGEYRVQLPDGRTQIVTYHADWKTGFHADVRYEGEAVYPEPNNGGYNYNQPQPQFGGGNGYQGNQDSYQPSSSYGPPGYH